MRSLLDFVPELLLISVNRNVMIADDGVTPILMDFGSCAKAKILIETRSQALMQQVGFTS